MNDVAVPDWVCLMVGRLVLEAEALRMLLVQARAEPSSGDVPAPEPVS